MFVNYICTGKQKKRSELWGSQTVVLSDSRISRLQLLLANSPFSGMGWKWKWK
jgi:hypothetical protein